MVKFSKREYQIIVRLGRRNADIANELGIEMATVYVHVANILKKLNAESRTEAVLKVIQKGLLSPHQFIV